MITLTEKQIGAIVNAIVEDISDRRGLRYEWDQIDDNTQEEIMSYWRQIVRSAGAS